MHLFSGLQEIIVGHREWKIKVTADSRAILSDGLQYFFGLDHVAGQQFCYYWAGPGQD